MTLIKTINETVGIREPVRTKLQAVKDFYSASAPDEHVVKHETMLYIKQALNDLSYKWKNSKRAEFTEYTYLNSNHRYREVGRMLSVIMRMETNRYDWDQVPHGCRETHKSLAIGTYIKAIYDLGGQMLLNKIMPRYYEINHKFGEGEWIGIDWYKAINSGLTFLHDERTIDDPILIRTNKKDCFNPLTCKTDTTLETADPRNTEIRAKLTWISTWFHALHISVDDPYQVAYYPSLRHYKEGREVRTRLGKYLRKYQALFCLEEKEIKQLTDWHFSQLEARKGWKVDWRESNDPDGWWDSYYNHTTVSSCMAKDYCERAVKSYAHEKSDLRLAYLYRINDNTKIKTTIGRAIVRGEHYVRVYPDPNGNAEGQYLRNWLEGQGYTYASECLEGALLKAVQCDHDDYHYYAPYVDGDYQNADFISLDDKPYLEIVNDGEYSLTNTSGNTSEDEEDEYQRYCEMCDHSVHEDDIRYIEYYDREYCDDCIDNEFHYCDNVSNYRLPNDCVYCESDGEHYADDGDMTGVVYSETQETYWLEEDCELVADESGEEYWAVVGHDNIVKLSTIFDFNYKYAFRDLAIELPDGFWIEKWDLNELGIAPFNFL